ncbi:beta-propeller domain-containing protein [Actinokineospora cianjurensis]|uniref:Beta propeller domain-containing protein n=1 Tax=Actinokineospora cianjurensis TaxID=585224 RepID=A0A421B4Z7_9PSEU|nr:beta-propeller domain-containing protein [Actinokineospora cianjurensis]RLK59360.1 beta propeller domain-containing protein [Actinokineospora cianjurensis]
MRAKRLTLGAVVVASACVAGGIVFAREPVDVAGPAPYVPSVRLVSYDSCADVEADLKKAAAERVTEFGLDPRVYDVIAMPAEGDAPPVAPKAPTRNSSTAKDHSSTGDHSSTNNHEAAADEPDLVKTDGRRIVTVADGTLRVVDTATRELTASLAMPGGGLATALLLDGDRALVAVPRFDAVDRDARSGGSMTTSLVMVDLAGGARVTGTLTVDGDYLDGRQVGSVARVVARSRPRLEFPYPSTLQRNRALIEDAPLERWLPRATLDRDGSRVESAVGCGSITRPSGYTGTAMLTVYTIDLRAPLGSGDPVSIAADGDTLYGTAGSLYIADDQWQRAGILPADGRPAAGHTDIHQFDISAPGKPVYVASGSVEGSLVNQYALSEYEGNLRVATTTAQDSAVHVLNRRGPGLARIGRVGGLGVGERIQSVRYLGPTAYVVTFRRTDPLYTVDLSNPTAPRVTGELKITGYSAYLHPLGAGRLLGVGQEATEQGRATGTQVSLFDTTTTPVRRLTQFHLPGTTSEAEFDAHAFLSWPDKNLVVIPIDTARGSGAVLALRVTGDQITELATLRHPTPSVTDTRIRRSLVAADTLWTLSSAGIQATTLDTMTPTAWIPFA